MARGIDPQFVAVFVRAAVWLAAAFLLAGGTVPAQDAAQESAIAPGQESALQEPAAELGNGRLIRVRLPLVGSADAQIKSAIQRAMAQLKQAPRGDGRRPILILELAPARRQGSFGEGTDFERAVSIARYLTSSPEMAAVKTVAYIPRSIKGHGVLVALAVVVMGRRREREVASELPPEVAAPTLLERMSSTEEYLEKTVTLRENPVLTVTRGPGTGQVFDLRHQAATSIGRAKANEVVIDDVSVSSEHCRIRPEDGHFVLHDLKSTNGTFVNERRITRHVLQEGDVLKIGETSLLFKTDLKRG